jgi:hypothetical protein
MKLYHLLWGNDLCRRKSWITGVRVYLRCRVDTRGGLTGDDHLSHLGHLGYLRCFYEKRMSTLFTKFGIAAIWCFT